MDEVKKTMIGITYGVCGGQLYSFTIENKDKTKGIDEKDIRCLSDILERNDVTIKKVE